MAAHGYWARTLIDCGNKDNGYHFLINTLMIMNTIVETITPIKAQEYLFTSKGNRPISKETVASYADSMKSGKWMLNGVPIVFDTDGNLIDGHHRLNAIVLAGVPIATAVARGVEKEAFTTFDCGRHRNLGQLLAMQGKKNYNVVSGIVQASITLRDTGRLYINNARNCHGQKRANYEGYDVYQKDSERFDRIASICLDLYRKIRMLKTSWIGAMIYHLTTIGGFDEEFVLQYFNELNSYVESDKKSIEILRVRILREKSSGIKSDDSRLIALLFKSWNAYAQGKDVNRLLYHPEVEEFPRLYVKQ